MHQSIPRALKDLQLLQCVDIERLDAVLAQVQFGEILKNIADLMWLWTFRPNQRSMITYAIIP